MKVFDRITGYFCLMKQAIRTAKQDRMENKLQSLYNLKFRIVNELDMTDVDVMDSYMDCQLEIERLEKQLLLEYKKNAFKY